MDAGGPKALDGSQPSRRVVWFIAFVDLVWLINGIYSLVTARWILGAIFIVLAVVMLILLARLVRARPAP